jgi:phage gp29-like protein
MSFFSRIAGALGFASERAAAPKRGTAVVPALSLWQQFTRIGGGLTPSQVSTILREADSGDMRRLMDLANESRQKDGHLHGCLEQSEQAIAGLQWQLTPPADAKAKEKKAAEWIESKLRENADLFRLISHLAGSFYYGYGVAEIIWAKGDEGRLLPARFELIDARRFGFRQDDGRFVWRDEGMSFDGVDLREEFPGKFIISRPRVTGDVPCREGLARLLVWAALFRNWTITDWLRLGEIAWKPWRIGKYRKDASKEDIAGLIDVLEGMSANGVARIPETVDVDVKWAPNGTTKPMHEVLYETIAREMSKAVIGSTETIQASSSSGYGQAKVHNEVRKDLREARAKQIATDITRDLIEVMIEINFGPSVRAPRFEFITQDPVDLKAFSEGMKNLREAGLKIPQAWVRDEAGIPEPKDDEECLGDGVDIPIDPETGLPAEPAEDAEQPKAEPKDDAKE